MNKPKPFKYIYGPVSSWRLGVSMGVDAVSAKKKICTFDCIYCQIGPTTVFSEERKIYVETDKIIEEMESLPSLKLDYITFSGRGEPTLAKNLGRLISDIKELRNEKIAVLTNSSLMGREDVREDLSKADFVIAKLDAPTDALFKAINKPMDGIEFDDVIEGIKKFRSEYSGRFAVQIMFLNKNKDKAAELAALADEIRPHEIQINTPLRPCGIEPLSSREIAEIKKHFLAIKNFNVDVVSVYEAERKNVLPISHEDAIKKRRGDIK